MFILLAILLTFISIAFRLLASSFEVVHAISKRNTNTIDHDLDKMVNVAIRSSSWFVYRRLRFISMVINIVRDLILWVGSFVLVLDVIVLVIVVISAFSVIALF